MEGIDWATQGGSLAGQGHDGISSLVSPLQRDAVHFTMASLACSGRVSSICAVNN